MASYISRMASEADRPSDLSEAAIAALYRDSRLADSMAADALAKALQAGDAKAAEAAWTARAAALMQDLRYEEAIVEAHSFMRLYAERFPCSGHPLRLMNIMGMAYRRIGMFETSFDILLQAEADAVAAGEDRSIALVRNNIASALFDLGDFVAAERFYRSAELFCRKAGDEAAARIARLNIAFALVGGGDVAGASAALDEQEAGEGGKDGKDRAQGNPTVDASRVYLEGLVAEKEGKAEKAIGLFAEAERRLANVGNRDAVLEVRTRRAAALLDAGKARDAIAIAREVADSIAKGAPANGRPPLECADSLLVLAKAFEAIGSWEEAARAYARYVDVDVNARKMAARLAFHERSGGSPAAGER